MSPPPSCNRNLSQPVEIVTEGSDRLEPVVEESQRADAPSGKSPPHCQTPVEYLDPKNVHSVRRYFPPQLLETSSRRSRDNDGEEVFSRARDHGGVEEQRAIPPPRRFLPQLVESTSRTSRKAGAETTVVGSITNETHLWRKDEGQNDDTGSLPRHRRRFEPVPIEATQFHRSGRPPTEVPANPLPARRRLVPQPVETTVRRRRKEPAEKQSAAVTVAHYTPGVTVASRSSDCTRGPRKFSPELLETARGFYRKGDGLLGSTIPPSKVDQNAVPACLNTPLRSRLICSPKLDEVPQIHESRFSAANLARHQTRQHSFVIPDLPSIESDSSNENSDGRSLSNSLSVSSSESRRPQIQRRSSGSPDGGTQEKARISMAAQATDRQLREQVMAAYPNEGVHEPVHHFAVEQSDDGALPGKLEGDHGTDPKTFRRESDADLDWHVKEMRRHHASRADGGMAATGEDDVPAAKAETPAKKAGGKRKGGGLTEMRDAASPPMLGEDLVFPLCASPKMTSYDVDQVHVPRSWEHEKNSIKAGKSKLWAARIGVQNNAETGLWMGLCQRDDCEGQSTQTALRSGLLTPALDTEHPARSVTDHQVRCYKSRSNGYLKLPANPTTALKDPFTESVDQKLNQQIDIERRIREEFHDGFVTQIYNYVSLGYPSLAHKFDHELSKISQVSIEELREDDERTDAKGYVGTPEGEGLDEAAVREGKCVRWTALKAYIHEWARQQSDMVDRSPDDWGVRARRGSWAF